ncbi:MAG: sodium:calcium antiporter [Nitrospirae bacterium]|nr:sodium:calcium antiporter [Nitrospirota bacterium]
MLWLGFLICTAAIVYSGTRLSKYGDIIAEKTGLGRAWIGIVLMASITSLPELVTGVGSVTFAGVPDIAVGDVLGSCVFNMLIFAILDTLYRPAPISTKAHQGHVLSAAFGLLLLSIVCISMFLREQLSPIGWLGPYSFLFIVIYFIGMRLVFSYEKRKIAEFLKEMAEELRYKDISIKTAVLHYTINALIVIIAAMFLPTIGEAIAVSTGLGQTFVGNIFIAVSTSLPEVVVSIAAVRMGAIDLAIGNLFGSNIFNICILAVDDIFFFHGPLLSYASADHIISALSAMAMTAIAIIGLTYRAEKKRLFVSWDSLAILVCYTANLLILYMLR